MNDKLYLKKLKSEYKFLKVEVEYQAELFETAKKEFDKKFSNLLNVNIPNEKKSKRKKICQKKKS